MKKPFNGEFTLTQGFGVNKPNYVQFGLEGHNGLDYALPLKTQVVAPHSGKVIEATFDSGYGNYLKIENDKEGSVLAHLDSFQVKVGDTVSEGQPIALSGTTGNSTGPHLHWGYYLFPRNRQNGFAGFIDQLPLLNQLPQSNYKDLYEQTKREKDAMQVEFDKTKVSLAQAQDRIKVLEKIVPANPLHEDVLKNVQREMNRLI